MENPILIHLLFVSPRIGTDAQRVSGVWNIRKAFRQFTKPDWVQRSKESGRSIRASSRR